MIDVTSQQEGALAGRVLDLVGAMLARFGERRMEQYSRREQERTSLMAGHVEFTEDTRHIRSNKWVVDMFPRELLERRTELLGSADRGDLIRGMNAGAKSYIADLWNFPCHDGVMRAHRNLERAARLDLAYMQPVGGRMRINPGSATRLMVAPRPMQVLESTVIIDGEPVPAAFLDLAQLATHCAAPLAARQGGLYLYLRDVQDQADAGLWAGLFALAEEQCQLKRGTVRATVLVDSISGALQAEEILFELVHHGAGLSLDPQAYLADHVALFSAPDRQVLPDRRMIGQGSSMLRALSHHLIGICHRRGCHAIGAPAFALPSVNGRPTEAYLEMLADKEREAVDGHDGTIVAHPGMVNAAMVEFNKSMARANQLYYQRNDAITPADLIRRPEGEVTVEGLRGLVRTALAGLLHGVATTGGTTPHRIHDRSSVRLAIRMLWQYRNSSKGIVSTTGLDISTDVLRFMARKEADKLYDNTVSRTARRVGLAIDQLVDLLEAERAPLEPMS